MTWLTQNLEAYIRRNPNQSVKWYALGYGCCEATVIKVQTRMANQSKGFRPWLGDVKSHIQRECTFYDDWKEWRPWRELYDKGMTPVSAVRTVI